MVVNISIASMMAVRVCFSEICVCYLDKISPILSTNVNPTLDSVSTDLIRKYFRRVLEYERAYLEGKKAGKELEQAVKVYKSHRRIFFEWQSCVI